MGCNEQWELLLSKYVDKQLLSSERQGLEQHIKQCLSCQETLQIFLKNDQLVASALAVDAEKSVTQAVLAKIRHEKEAAVALVEEQEPFSLFSLASRWGKVAAVVLIGVLATLTGFAVYSYYALRNVEDNLEQERRSKAQLDQRYKQQIRFVLDSSVQKTAAARENEKEPMMARIPNAVRLQGVFPPTNKKLSLYAVYRKAAGDSEKWMPLTTGLTKPEYTDATAEPGKRYHYKFVGITDKGETVESFILSAPSTADWNEGSRYLEITYLRTAEDQSAVLLGISKEWQGKRIEELFVIKPGEEVGHRIYNAQAMTEVDFSTGLKLSTIEADDEIINIHVITNSTDPKTGQVILDPQTKLPKVEEKWLPSLARPSMRITLQTASGNTFALFQSRSKKVPVEK